MNRQSLLFVVYWCMCTAEYIVFELLSTGGGGGAVAVAALKEIQKKIDLKLNWIDIAAVGK